MRVRAAVRRTIKCRCLEDHTPGVIRSYATSLPYHKTNVTAHSRPIDPRWLSDMKQRIGRCITFGLTSHQLEQAGSVLQQLAFAWTELVVGTEGYLTAPGRIGLDKQAVVWGEMVHYMRLHITLQLADQDILSRIQWYAFYPVFN